MSWTGALTIGEFADGRHGSVGSCATNPGDPFEKYQAAYRKWERHAIGSRALTSTLQSSSNEVASKLTYQFMSNTRIMTTLALREHTVPKLFKRIAPITRCERYVTLLCVLQIAFAVQSVLFRADCLMVPKPAVCGPPANWWEKYLPTWSTLFATAVGAAFTIPGPLVLLTLFKKMPIQEMMTDREKALQRNIWRCKQCLGWVIALCVDAFVCVWLIMFAGYFGMTSS